MTYIKKEPVMVEQLVCTHPKVKRIWEYGGGSADPSDNRFFYYLCLILEDGTKKEFKDNGYGKAKDDAEAYLKTI